MAKDIAYYRHTVKVEPAIPSNGRIAAYRKPISPVDRPLNQYSIYGLNFIKSPWRVTHDYSRILAVAREISLRWPDYCPLIVVESVRFGWLPITQFRNGVAYPWRGRGV